MTAEYVKTVRDAGFEFHVWTIDDLADTLEAFRRGAQTVTTNCAKKLLDELENSSSMRTSGPVRVIEGTIPFMLSYFDIMASYSDIDREAL